MPTYDYECQECGEVSEFFHSMSADPKTECPLCGEHALKRLIGGGAGLLFKGSGFYITDYRSKDYKEKAKKEKEKKDGKTDSSGGKSEPGQSKGDSPDSGKRSNTSSKPKSTKKTD